MSDDLIKRSDAIKAVRDSRAWHFMDILPVLSALKAIPSADRPQGHWIRHEHSFWTFVNDKGERGGWIPDYECNLCGSRGWESADVMNFCPNCGARMKGADDDSV